MMAIFPKLDYRFSVISIKMPAVFFTEIDKMNLKLSWKYEYDLRMTKTIFKRNEVRGLKISNFKT